jgi:hypothetical protein
MIGSDLRSDLLAWAEVTVNVAIRRTTESGSAQTRSQLVDAREHQGSDAGAHGRDAEAGAPSLPCGPQTIPERPAMNVNGKVTVVTGGASVVGPAPSGLGSSNVRPHGPDQAQRQQPPHLY